MVDGWTSGSGTGRCRSGGSCRRAWGEADLSSTSGTAAAKEAFPPHPRIKRHYRSPRASLPVTSGQGPTLSLPHSPRDAWGSCGDGVSIIIIVICMSSTPSPSPHSPLSDPVGYHTPRAALYRWFVSVRLASVKITHHHFGLPFLLFHHRKPPSPNASLCISKSSHTRAPDHCSTRKSHYQSRPMTVQRRHRTCGNPSWT